MDMERHRVLGLLGLGLSLAMLGCSAEVGDDVAVTGEELRLAFTPFEDPEGVGPGSERAVTEVIYSARQYRRLFGHAAPADVDFRREIVVFYSAGVQPTGGYEATVESVDLRRNTLAVTTRLSSPGEHCVVTQALTHPYALVKVDRPRRSVRVRFQSDDVVTDCEAPPDCNLVDCPDGTHCEIQQVWCITAPCPALAVCVPTPPFCGGIAGFPCPGAGTCVDVPDDGCDPEDGGADCGGQCTCEVEGLCEEGFAWDNSPGVCDCVPVTQDPCAVVRCREGTHCEADGDTASCVPDGPFCGGFAGIACPGAGNCVDNPGDACDPDNGGADCGGICECNAVGLCIAPLIWDSSAAVCGCVEPTNPCAAVLCLTGSQCEVIDGAPVCVSNGSLACGASVCGEGMVCCNASCGVCTPPDGVCTQQACVSTD